MKIEKKVLDMSLAGIFTAIIIAMSVVPFLGYIPLGFMNATIIHVPVIIGAIILGPKYGAYLGLVFGAVSYTHLAVYKRQPWSRGHVSVPALIRHGHPGALGMR